MAKRFKKGSPEAKRFMASLRAKKGKPAKKKKAKVGYSKDRLTILQDVTKELKKTYNKKAGYTDRARKIKEAEKKVFAKIKVPKKDSAFLKKYKADMRAGKSQFSGVRKLSTRKSSIFGTPQAIDRDAMREIEIFVENDYETYDKKTRPNLIALSKRYKKGTYSQKLSEKAFYNIIVYAMMRYQKVHGGRGSWSKLLSVSDRKILAKQFADETAFEFSQGNFTER